MMRRFVFFLFACAAAAAAVAQGVLPLDQTMRFGVIRTSFSGPCGWSTLPTTAADEGTVTLLPNGTCTVLVDQYAVCPGGVASVGPVESGSGTYQVATDGTMVVNWLPSQPGVDDDTVMLRADGSVLARTRFTDRNEESVVMIGIALSSGRTLGSLNGPYRVLRFAQLNPATGLVLQGDFGTIQFDGVGGYVDQGMRRNLPLGGAMAILGYGPRIGTYTVDPDGTVTTAVGARGAVSADGEVFFWMRRAGSDVSLTIGLRQGTTYDPAMASGAWRWASMHNGIGAALPQVDLSTDWGTVDLQPTGGGGGTLSLDVLHVVSIPTQTSSVPQQMNDAFALSPQGDLLLFSKSPAPMPGALCADGSMFAALTVSGDRIGLTVGMAAARWPTPFGTPTAGTGGFAPSVLTLGGFPYVGNHGFGLVVVGGLGGTLAGLSLAGGASNGLPMFGGLVWLDPNLHIGSFTQPLSGPSGQPGAGAAAIPLPLPILPGLAGMPFACQAFTLDPVAPQGVAMSRGLDLTICR